MGIGKFITLNQLGFVQNSNWIRRPCVNNPDPVKA